MTRSTLSSIADGRALFNRGEYFRAHEVWEEAWLVETGGIRRMLQGLIQIAAAFLKAGRREHPGGCLRLLDAGMEKLEDGDGAFIGLALRPFLSGLRDLRPSVVAWVEGTGEAPALDSFPRLEELPPP